VCDISSDFSLNVDRNHCDLVLYCTLFDEDQKATCRNVSHVLKANEVIWPANSRSTLSWQCTPSDFQDVKAVQPKIKVHVALETDGTMEECGFFIVDLRNIFHEESIQEIPIMNMQGARILLAVRIIDTPDPVPSSFDVRGSQNSLSSVLTLPSKYDRNPINTQRYALEVHLQKFRNISTASNDSPTFWFCWSILDVTIQSEVYSAGKVEPSNECLFFECSEEALTNFLRELSCLRIFLCIPGKILSMAEVPLVENHDHVLPVYLNGWFPLIRIDGGEIGDERDGGSLSVQISVRPGGQVDGMDAITGDLDTSNVGEDESPYDNESFHEDSDEDYAPPPPQESVEAPTPPLPSVPAPAESTDDTLSSPYVSKKYRLSIQVKSIRGMSRAGHVSIQFSYPYLGSRGSPVRTRPIWNPAHADTPIDGAAATFEFVMLPAQLEAILNSNKLVVQLLSRSQLGMDKVGDGTVALDVIFTSKAHVEYRCSLTGKLFKTMEQYVKHRQTMLALYSLGRVNVVPPRQPVVLRSADMFVPVVALADETSTPSRTVAEVGKMRTVIVLEELSPGEEVYKATPSMIHSERKPKSSEKAVSSPSRTACSPPAGISSEEELDLIRRLDWEEWRRQAEVEWSAALREKEVAMRRRLEEESAATLAQKADDLRRAQEEVGRLEVRLRSSIDVVERQKAQLQLKEEQMNIRLAQKTDELQLLQRKVREEAKARVDSESRRASALETQVKSLTEAVSRAEKRASDAERDYESYRLHVRSMPETALREEAAKVKSQVGELRAEVERERRLRSEVELEKEHYRAQMQRIAIALKRERERSSAAARQELEQLRLEFLAREERYILDGDRDELKTIREELSVLRMMNSTQNGGSKPTWSTERQRSTTFNSFQTRRSVDNVRFSRDQLNTSDKLKRLLETKTELLESGLYKPDDSVIQELENSIMQEKINLSESSKIGGSSEVK